MNRVVVFIDYQNAYRGARDMYFDHDSDPNWYGQFEPLKLGELLTARGNVPRELTQVRVYRGMPSASHEPRSYAKTRAQIASWEIDARVKVITRPLKYPPGWPNKHSPGSKPGEKGIDVQLAMDFATMAVRKEYDFAILVSRDSDLIPPLEFVLSHEIDARCEVATWRDGKRYSSRLLVRDGLPYCHWITREEFTRIQDMTDYSRHG